MIKICFICTGNTCRSVIAEKLLIKELKARGLDNVKVTSAGVAANGEDATENTKKVLKEHGITVRSRKSKGLKKTDSKTLYITMGEVHKQYVKAERVVAFGEFVGCTDISDPHGQTLEVYRTVANIIKSYVKQLADKLEFEIGRK